MNDDTKEAFFGALKAFLKAKNVPHVYEVTGFKERTESGGYCDTCFYTSYHVDIYYVDIMDKESVYDHYGDFGELIRELTA